MYWTFLVVRRLHLLAVLPADRTMSSTASTARSPFDWQWADRASSSLIFVLGFFMSLGKAAVYKHIPVYYPKRCGAVGGLVGMIGGLGGFVLPIVFGVLNDLTGIWRAASCCCSLIVAVALIWMHVAIRQMEREAAGQRSDERCRNCPEMQPIHGPTASGALVGQADRRLATGGPSLLEATGKRSPRRNLWIPSLPAAVLCSLDGLVGRRREASAGRLRLHHRSAVLAGRAAWPFGRNTADLLQLHGADVRRPAVDDADDLVAADPGPRHRACRAESGDTLLRSCSVLALLCGFGGGNFASSMSNIGFFFPKAEKGNALALNAGLGNLGVSRRCSSSCHWSSPWVFSVRSAATPQIAVERRDQALAAECGLHLGAVHHRLAPSRPGSA